MVQAVFLNHVKSILKSYEKFHPFVFFSLAASLQHFFLFLSLIPQAARVVAALVLQLGLLPARLLLRLLVVPPLGLEEFSRNGLKSFFLNLQQTFYRWAADRLRVGVGDELAVVVQPLRLDLRAVEALERRRGPQHLKLLLLVYHVPVCDLVDGLPAIDGRLSSK